jgi:hypothetical protein
MTLEERVSGLEDAVMHLSNILELDRGVYDRHVNPAIRANGGEVRRWAESVRDHRAEA